MSTPGLFSSVFLATLAHDQAGSLTGESMQACNYRQAQLVACLSTLGLILTSSCLWVAAEQPPEENRLQPTEAPTPFRSDEIRRDCPSGSWRRFQVESLGNKGWITQYQTTTFVVSSEVSTEVESVDSDSTGEFLGQPQRITATWKQLQAHASFSAENTTIESVPLALGADEFKTWHYTITATDAGIKTVTHMWFAKTLAGPPVYMEKWSDEVLTFKMTLVDHGNAVAAAPDEEH
jgi:hypothetical protein